MQAAYGLLRSTNDVRSFSLDRVGKAAGVSRLTVYNQFGSRRALLEAVFDERAARGGLHRLTTAMADPRPIVGLRMLVNIFCDFWSQDLGALAWMLGAAAVEAELAESLAARQERRRRAIGVLVDRMVKGKTVRDGARQDLIDVLFTLTSFPVFAQLSTGDRRPETVEALIQAMVDDAVRRAAPTRTRQPKSRRPS